MGKGCSLNQRGRKDVGQDWGKGVEANISAYHLENEGVHHWGGGKDWCEGVEANISAYRPENEGVHHWGGGHHKGKGV